MRGLGRAQIALLLAWEQLPLERLLAYGAERRSRAAALRWASRRALACSASAQRTNARAAAGRRRAHSTTSSVVHGALRLQVGGHTVEIAAHRVVEWRVAKAVFHVDTRPEVLDDELNCL